MKNPERDKNLERIKALHRALRYTACGACPPGFEHLKLIQISRELLARLEVENFCIKMDKPTYFIELGKAVVRDISKKESRPTGHELN